MSQTTKNIAASIKAASVAKTSPYDTQGIVKRIEGSTAWVHIPGGVDETPVKMTISAKIGDNVQVRVGDGSAWLVGNASAPPTDDTRANTAYTIASTAEEESKIAHNAAQSAVASAADAKATADSVHGIAVQALADAATAKGAADNASEYAARALGNLSTVQSVTETLNWITQHGTMALTTDVALDPTHVYFVVDPLGDYEVGGTHYSVVTEPDVDDIGTYYELSIDESLNNYVGTHLALTSEGLWLLPASSGTYKVLIATGAGSVYTSPGMYIIDSAGKTVAKYMDNIIIGIDDGTQSYLALDYHSMRLIDKEGDTYFHVSDLRDANGELEVTDTFQGDGSETYFRLTYTATNTEYIVEQSGSGYHWSYTKTKTQIIFNGAPDETITITVTYKTTSQDAKAYTLGFRNSSHALGGMSVVEGYNAVASGRYSHAEGYETQALGFESHAEGYRTISGYRGSLPDVGAFTHSEGRETQAIESGSHAEGMFSIASGSSSHAEGTNCRAKGRNSHAQNDSTIANMIAQTSIGTYNIEDTTPNVPVHPNGVDSYGNYAFIIGNGYQVYNAGSVDVIRSNALTVDWTGNILMALDTTASTGTTDGDLYAAITALGWQSDVIV